MRRENRKKDKLDSNTSIYIAGGILFVAILAFIIAFVWYFNKLDNDLYALDSEYLAQYNDMENTEEANQNTTSVSSSVGKTVEEAANNMVTNTNTKSSTKKETTANKTTGTSSSKQTSKTTVKKDPTFTKPLEGEISKDFVKDNLIYSETLKEWTTHYGVDIKAEKATVVKSAAEGTVKSIKNDPRYGLTIIIEHDNGFETLYANLLTTEFVSEGEKVKAGQTIGTVGDSAIYEIVDESHLHFELLKNSENLNPNDYIQF